MSIDPVIKTIFIGSTLGNGGLASISVDITLQRQLCGGQNTWQNARN